MEGNRGFNVPNNEPHTDEEVFDAEMEAKIAQLDEEIQEEEEFDQKSREICEKVLQQQRLKDVVNIFGVLTEKAYYVEFSEEAIRHVEKLLSREIKKEQNGLQSAQFIIPCCQTLERFGFPQESITQAIAEGLVVEGVDESGERLHAFAMNSTDLLDFIKSLQSRYHEFSTDLLINVKTREAAVLLMRSLLKGGDTLKRVKELIRVFDLRGPEVTGVMQTSVEKMIQDGNLNSRRLENLSNSYLVQDAYETYEINTKDEDNKIDKAWRKLQERYGITESYSEMQRSLFDKALEAQDNDQIRKICNGQSKVLAELVTAQTLPKLIQLAEDTVYIASNIKTDLGGASYSDKGWIVGAVLEQFNIPLDTIQKWFEYTSFDNKLYLQRFCKEVLDPDAVLTLELLGQNASGRSYDFIKDIRSEKVIDTTEQDLVEKSGMKSIDEVWPRLFTEFGNDLTKEVIDTLAQAGITKSGEAGIQQLRVLLTQLKHSILQEDFDVAIVAHNPVLRDFVKGYLRIDEREWGTRSLKESISLYDEQKGKIKPLDEAVYQSSELLRIQTSEVGKDFEYSEQFFSAFKTLNRDIDKARRLIENDTNKPFSNLVEHLNQEVGRVIDELQKSRQDLPEEKRGFIDERISRLEALNFRDLTKLDHNLAELNKIPEAHRVVRQLIFTFAYSKSQGQNMYFPASDYTQPALSDITGTINFVDHIAYQETWAQYFKDKKSRNNFRQIASTRALEEELERMQKNMSGEIGSTVMQFVPTRGFLMEVSGSLADACWQDTNDDLIAVEHPNFTSVTFIQNPETKDERIAGAVMLIETESRDGEKLLVIRGLNPLENVINRLSVADFYQKFTEYCKGIAERGGRKLAIVIDDHSGGSATNRPVLFQYLRNLELRKVVLARDEDTTFNNYTITDNTFLVE